jgi:arsenate reductase (glutaredoxin)
MKYKSMGLKEIIKTDLDYRAYILDEYTFLKRPVFILEGEYFAGNSKKTIEQIIAKLV